jgi:branched-chain amino acid transport system ATP-binding protein
MSAPLLEIKELRAGYGEAEVLHGIELSVSQGEFVCIIGANTAGKSTILRCISRLVPKSSGVMRFGEANLAALAAHQIPTLGIAHVPEGRQIFPDMTVEENLLLGAFSARKARELTTCSIFFPACASGSVSLRGRCRAANSRWLRSAAL